MALSAKHLEAAEAASRRLAARSPDSNLRAAASLREMKSDLKPKEQRVVEEVARELEERARAGQVSRSPSA